MAISVPAPRAKPTLAAANAGASLIPSPTMPTTRPAAVISSTIFAFSSGCTPPRASSIPTDSATRRTTACASPDSTVARTPMSRSASMAAAAVSRMGSLMPIMPSRRLASATKTTVVPSVSQSRASAREASSMTTCLATNSALPTQTRVPFTTPRAPKPGTASNSRSGSVFRPASLARSTIARAKGCSLPC